MDLQIPLAIRLAAPASHEETTATPETPDPPSAAGEAGPGRAPSHNLPNPNALSPNSLVAGSHAAGNTDYVSGLRGQAATGQSSHQFWLKDAKVAEDLFTIHRSAQDLANFTSSIIGNNDSATGYRPIPVMSDGDVLFMTQLSNDIVRSVNGITSIRQHGTRMRRRKIMHGHAAPPKEHSVHASRASRGENTAAAAPRLPRENTALSGGGSRRLRKSIEDDQLQQCYKCGRKETPEWRKGPDGLLCNSCGLVYAKQRRKQKMADKAEKGDGRVIDGGIFTTKHG